MATTTRTDTSYSATLLRLHALEEYTQAEIAAIKDAIAELEPGGGSGDQDRIYSITVGGAQSPPSSDPQAPTVYDTAATSVHLSVWGTSSEALTLLSDGSMRPMIDLIGYGAPEEFFTSGSAFTATFGDADMYTAISGVSGTGSVADLLFGTTSSNYSYATHFQTTGKNFYSLTFGSVDNADSLSASRSMYSLTFGNSDNAAVLSASASMFRLTFGNEDNPSALGSRSIFGLAFQNDINAASLVADGKSLWEMIKACEARLTAGGL